ncbi:deoxynucleoside kinase [Burkholderia sp. Se-20373]|uniref:deoxynucleoside kinase n=1 Tax=Burkholderia sp. Se-20373 TaxID=2703898 RepID=UPI00197DBB7D|nr:deoxynucleoside kinase [Burkholderia sp. Se-20373]MBN3743927.1 deoxynucleoside kinase [Burkholderia sp. Se-20373]
MSHHPLIVAIEGRSCAGKTTLARSLCAGWPDQFTHMVDYCDMVGGGKNLPRAIPRDLQEEARALTTFASLDALRSDRVQNTDTPVFLLDRSIYSILAHCYALSATLLEGCATLAERMVPSLKQILWPDFIVYLNLPDEEAMARNARSIARESILMNSLFNDHLADYFSTVHQEHPTLLHYIDARRPIGDISQQVYELCHSQRP